MRFGATGDSPASTLGPIRTPPIHAARHRSAPLTGPSAAASDAARQLLTREVADLSSADAAATAAVIERVCERMGTGLARWIGPDGYRALLRRALHESRDIQPEFAILACDGNDGARVAEAVDRNGAEPSLAALESLVGILMKLLGRIVGEAMAIQLVEQAVAGGPAGTPATPSRGEVK